MSAADLHIYEALIPVIAAEEARRDGRAMTPEDIGATVAEETGDEVAGMVAEAKAKLAEAARRKG